MTQHHHQHPQTHSHQGEDKNRGLHKDWRTWAVVLLMLAGMAAYVLSMDEADSPNGPAGGERVPAAAG